MGLRLDYELCMNSVMKIVYNAITISLIGSSIHIEQNGTYYTGSHKRKLLPLKVGWPCKMATSSVSFIDGDL